MAKKGSTNKQKRLSVDPVRHLKRKDHTWTIRQKPGAHSQYTSVPLGFVVRDMLNLGQTLKEAKGIITKGLVHVDGKVRKSHQFAVGLFDTITIPSLQKQYRLALDQKGRLIIHEASETLLKTKPGKVVRKAVGGEKKIAIQTHDGNTFKGVDNAIRVDDSVLVFPDGKIAKHLPLHKGSRVFITGGSHAGEIATVSMIVEGTMKRDKLVDLVEGKEAFQTNVQNIMVIDENTADWLKKVGGNTE